MQEKGINPAVKSYRSDLDLAPIETVHPVFTTENMSTCFFHFAQAYWRKIQRLGLVDLYVSNEQYSVLLISFTALAFVPTERVPDSFKYLSDSVPEDVPTAIHDFVEYIADTYVGHEIYETAEKEGAGLVLRIRRTPRWKGPIFPAKLWSVYDRVLNDEPRTTNMLEGWHRRFSTVVAKHHPNIYYFIGCLRAEQARTETVISKLVMGEAPRKIRKIKKEKNVRIKKIVQDFQDREMNDYLRDLAYNIKYNVA